MLMHEKTCVIPIITHCRQTHSEEETEYTNSHKTPKEELSNSYTMGCLPVRGDNPTSYSMWIILRTGGQTWYILFYTTYICVDLAHDEIFRAKCGKGGIKLRPEFFSGNFFRI